MNTSRPLNTAVTGGKGANLVDLISAGFPVPPGFVVTTPAEDLADASFAGQHDTYLNPLATSPTRCSGA